MNAANTILNGGKIINATPEAVHIVERRGDRWTVTHTFTQSGTRASVIMDSCAAGQARAGSANLTLRTLTDSRLSGLPPQGDGRVYIVTPAVYALGTALGRTDLMVVDGAVHQRGRLLGFTALAGWDGKR